MTDTDKKVILQKLDLIEWLLAVSSTQSAIITISHYFY